MYRRVGENPYQRRARCARAGVRFCVLACALSSLSACLADTEAGEGRDGRGVPRITIRPPKAGSSDPMTVAPQDDAGSAAAPPISSGTAGMGGAASGAGSAAPPPAGGTAGSMEVTQPPPPMDREFDAGTDPGRNMVQKGAVCQRLAQIQCAGEAFCCPNPGRTVAQCETVSLKGCIDEAYLDAVTANSITAFNATKAAAAFDHFEMLASQCDISIAEYGASATGLLSMLEGTIEAGKSCSPSGFTKASAAASLAACLNGATTACLPTSSLIWTCTARGAAGAKCFSDLNCQDGLHCPNPSLVAGEFGTAACAPRKAEGAACMQPNECTSLVCKDGACAASSVEAAYCLTN